MEEKQKGDPGGHIKENEEGLKQHGEKKAQTEDAAEQKDSVTTEQDNGKDNKEKDSVRRLSLNTFGTRFPLRGWGEGGGGRGEGRGEILIFDTLMFIRLCH